MKVYAFKNIHSGGHEGEYFQKYTLWRPWGCKLSKVYILMETRVYIFKSIRSGGHKSVYFEKYEFW